MPAETVTLTLKDAFLISKRVKHFIFQLPPHNELNYLPGQFITIYFTHQDKLLHRSYSIACAPGQANVIEIAAGLIENGPGTEYLFQLVPGDVVEAKGPFGRLILKNPPPARYILLATSTGITPYRAMLPELTQQLLHNPTLEVIILQGVQTQADLLYHAEFIAFAETNPRITYRAQLSRETLTENVPYLHAGHVQSAFSELNLQPEQDMIYLCGNPNMVDESFTWLKERGFALQHIIREKYISR
jgi:NAD(P)H-flavin reductase